MKFKKLVGAIAAATIAVSAFAGFGVSASAAGELGGNYDEETKTFTWSLPTETYAPTEDTVYNAGDADNAYADVEVGLISGDSISTDGIYFANPTFGDGGTPVHRYIKITPTKSGVFSMSGTISKISGRDTATYNGEIFIQEANSYSDSNLSESIQLTKTGVYGAIGTVANFTASSFLNAGTTYIIYFYEWYGIRVDFNVTSLSFEPKETVTAPEAMTTGNEAEYYEYIGDATLVTSTTVNLSSKASIGDRMVLEYDAYVPDGGKLTIEYNANGNVGPKLILDSTDNTDVGGSTAYTWVKYDTSNKEYAINSSEEYSIYEEGTWAHVTAVCNLVAGTSGAGLGTLRIEPITMTVEPSNGEEWTTNTDGGGRVRLPYNNREIDGRNIRPDNESGRNFDRFIITATGDAYIANMVTYSLPSITAEFNSSEVTNPTNVFEVTDGEVSTTPTPWAEVVTDGTQLQTVLIKVYNSDSVPTVKAGEIDYTPKANVVNISETDGSKYYIYQFADIDVHGATVSVDGAESVTLPTPTPAA